MRCGNKRCTTCKGRERGGLPFTKVSIHKLLTNVTEIGKVKYKDGVHAGEHAAIVSDDIWQRTQVLLERNSRTGGVSVRNKFGALLKGLFRCLPCGCAMTPNHAVNIVRPVVDEVVAPDVVPISGTHPDQSLRRLGCL